MLRAAHAAVLASLAATALVAGLAAPAFAAVPAFVTMHGVLRLGADPVDGPVDLTVRLYDGASALLPFWEEQLDDVPVTAGYYSVRLGLGATLDSADLLLADGVRVGLAINGGAELSPRLPLGSVPYALAAERAAQADSALALDCTGCVAPPQVGFGYAGSSTQGGAAQDLECSAACVQSTEIDNASVTSAKLAIPITIGSLTATASAVGVGTGAPVATLDVNGGVRVGTVAAACTAGLTGTLRVATGKLQFCDGTTWSQVAMLRLGEGPSNPAPSCRAIYQAGVAHGDGTYWIDPTGGSTADAFTVWCDMSSDGGGWTLVAKTAGTGTGHQSATDNNLAALGSQALDASATMGDVKRLALGRHYRFTCDGVTRYAYLTNASASVSTHWGADMSVLAWSATYADLASGYTENSGPDCGTADCNGPSYGGRNWMRIAYEGCGLFNLASPYSHAGRWWAK